MAGRNSTLILHFPSQAGLHTIPFVRLRIIEHSVFPKPYILHNNRSNRREHAAPISTHAVGSIRFQPQHPAQNGAHHHCRPDQIWCGSSSRAAGNNRRKDPVTCPASHPAPAAVGSQVATQETLVITVLATDAQPVNSGPHGTVVIPPR